MIRLKGNETSWGAVAKFFHWVVAVLLIIQITLGLNLHFIDFSPTKLEFINFHKVIGSTILLLILARLMWKLYNPRPSNHKLPKLHHIFSNITHFVLYFLLLIIPINGMLYTWFSGFDVPILGLFDLPRLVSENKQLAKQLISIHYNLTLLLLGLFIIHLCVALYHRFVINDKYGIWKRMSLRTKK